MIFLKKDDYYQWLDAHQAQVISYVDQHDVPVREMGLSPETAEVLRKNGIQSFRELAFLELDRLDQLTSASAVELDFFRRRYFHNHRNAIAQDEKEEKPVRQKVSPPKSHTLTPEGTDARIQTILAEHPAWLKIPVEKLGLSRRGYNCLKRNGCDRIGQLADAGWEGVAQLHGVGIKTASEVYETLNRYLEEKQITG